MLYSKVGHHKPQTKTFQKSTEVVLVTPHRNDSLDTKQSITTPTPYCQDDSEQTLENVCTGNPSSPDKPKLDYYELINLKNCSK